MSEQVSNKYYNSIITINVRGLLLMKDRTKVEQIAYIGKQYNAIIIVLTETWLEPSILDAEINIPGFNIHRTDRCGRKRGGTCIYTRCDLPVSKFLSYSNGVVDTITIKIPSLDLVIN